MEELTYTYKVKYLPLNAYNRVWRWLYMLRKAIARMVRNYFARVYQEITKPILYNNDDTRHRDMGEMY